MNEDDVEYLLRIKDEFSAVLDKFEAKAAQAEGAGHKLTNSTHEVAGGFGHMKEMIMGGIEALALYEVYDFAKESFEDFSKLQDVTAGIDQILKNTKESAGQTSDSLHELAERQQELTIYSVRQTLESEKMLLAFTNIRGEIYERSLPAIEDMASFMKTDLKTATEIVGKALNNPTMAARLLRAEGVVLSKQQTELLSHLQATGHMAEAQGLILGELEKRYKGAGEAAANTASGGLKQIANQFEEVKESIGEVIAQGLGKLTPYIKEGVAWLKEMIATIKKMDWSPFIQPIKDMIAPLRSMWNSIREIGEIIGVGGDKVSFFNLLVKEMAMSIGFVFKPIVWMANGVAKLVHALKNLIEHTTWLKNLLHTTVSVVKGFYAAITDAFYKIGEIGGKIFGGLGKVIKGMFTFDWTEMKGGLSDLKSSFLTVGSTMVNSYKDAYNGKTTLEKFSKEGGKGEGGTGGLGKMPNFGDGAGAGSVKESKNTVINITLGALNQGGINVHAASVTEGAAEIEAIFMKIFTSMLNNSQVIAGG